MLDLGLTGKVAIVTGGSEGLGRATAMRFAAEGCHVVICARRKDVLEQAAETIRKRTGVQVLAQAADVTRPADVDVKLMAAIRLCRLVIPQMKKRGGGRIVNVTTVGGKVPVARALPTSVTRAAGINLTKSLANEYASDHILVSTVCLGLVKSAQWERRAKGDLEGYYREVAKRVPVGRVGEAEEFADLVAFLCSARAAYITGTAINFDGGMSAAF